MACGDVTCNGPMPERVQTFETRNSEIRSGTIPEIMMRYVSRYLSHDTCHDTSLMLILIDYQAKIKEA